MLRAKTIQLLGENIKENIVISRAGKKLLNITPNTQSIKKPIN